jgi:hypothetical protein
MFQTLFASRQVVAQSSLPCPQTAIEVAVDTSYIIAQSGQGIGTDIYMVDNELNNGSSGEGTLELSTKTNAGNLIGWQVAPIDPNTGDSVVITGFNVSQGNVFGSQGYPIQQDTAGAYWVGQAMNAGSQTYQIQIMVTSGGIRPTKYFVNWDPFVTAF